MFFFFNDTATTEIYTLSLHDALPISIAPARSPNLSSTSPSPASASSCSGSRRSEEHTSELQSPCNLVCRLLLEKKKNKKQTTTPARQPATHTTTETRTAAARRRRRQR